MASPNLSTAAVGAPAPSRAQDNPPKAIMLAPMAALANITKRSSGSVPAVTSAASDQNTTALAASTRARLAATGRSRSFVASQRRSWSRRRCWRKRSMIQSARPNSRSSLAAGASTARR